MRKKKANGNLFRILGSNAVYFFWAFYIPSIKSLAYGFECNPKNNKQIIDYSLECYSDIHITVICISALMLILAIISAGTIAVFFDRTEYNQEDSLSTPYSPFSLTLFVFMTITALISNFDDTAVGLFVIRFLFTIVCSALMCYNYRRYIPFYNPHMSTIFGFEVYFLMWIVINAICTYILPVTGHFEIICVGIVPVYFVAKNMRRSVLETLLHTHPDKIDSEQSAIVQCCALNALVFDTKDESFESVFRGLIQSHSAECTKTDCPLYNPGDLYDPKERRYMDTKDPSTYATNYIYRKHFVKHFFESALINFSNSPDLHISFASFVFYSFENVHLALSELNAARKNKPSFLQAIIIEKLQYFFVAVTLYKRTAIENSLVEDPEYRSELYYNMHRVIEFEQILKEFFLQLNLTCEAELNFWSYLLTTNTVDFNSLDKETERIYKHTQEAQKLWEELCEIHPNHPKAKNKYSAFQRDILHNTKLANSIKERYKYRPQDKILSAMLQNNDRLFSDGTAVVIVSGSRDSLGNVLNGNRAISLIFGYMPQELLGNSINKIMPSLFAKRHNEMMIAHFVSGKNKVLKKERNLFGMHKDGSLLPMRLMVKICPQLDNNCINYVGLGYAAKTENEFIITDYAGRISCMTDRFAKRLCVNHSWVHQTSGLNVVLLIPELLSVYFGASKKVLDNSAQRYRENPVDVKIISPRGLEDVMRECEEKLKKIKRRKTKRNESLTGTLIERYNTILNQRKNGLKVNSDISTNLILDLKEYKTSEMRYDARVKILDLVFGTGECIFICNYRIARPPLKVRVLEISHMRDASFSGMNDEVDLLINGGMYERDYEVLSSDRNKIDSEKAQILNKILNKYGTNDQNYQLNSSTPHSEDSGSIINKSDHVEMSRESSNVLNILGLKHVNEGFESVAFPSGEIGKISQIPKKEPEELKEIEEESEDMNEGAAVDINAYTENFPDPSTKLKEKTQGQSAKDLSVKMSGKDLSIKDLDSRREPSNDVADILFALADSKPAKMFHINKMATNNPRQDVYPEKIEIHRQTTVAGIELQKKETLKIGSQYPSVLELENKDVATPVLGERITDEDIHPKKQPSQNEYTQQINRILLKGILSISPDKDKVQEKEEKRRRPQIYDKENITGNEEDGPIDLYVEDKEEKAVKRHFALYKTNKSGKLEYKNSSVNEALRKSSSSEESDSEEKDEKSEDEKSQNSNSSLTAEDANRALQNLRDAIEEKHVPSNLRYANIAAILLLIALIILYIAYFVIQQQINTEDSDNVTEISFSEKRTELLIDINLRIRSLILLNSDLTAEDEDDSLIDENVINEDDLLNNSITLLKMSATKLLQAQNSLSMQTRHMSSKEKASINPAAVDLAYKALTPLMPSVYTNSIWDAVMAVVVCSFRISNMTIAEINMDNVAVNTVVKNSLNSIYIALQDSTSAIVKQVEDRHNYDRMTMAIIFFISIGCILLSMVFLPSLHKALSYKEYVLKLLCELSKDDVRDYQKNCEQFKRAHFTKGDMQSMKSIHESAHEQTPIETKSKLASGAINPFPTTPRTPKPSTFVNQETIPLIHQKEKSSEKKLGYADRKYKGKISSFGIFAFKMFMAILAILGYFLITYLHSTTFLQTISDLVEEFSLLLSRASTHSLLLLMQKYFSKITFIIKER